jgi:hypothetical protein
VARTPTRTPTRKLKLKADNRVITLESGHEAIHVRPGWWTLAFINGKKDENGFDVPEQEMFAVLDIATMRWKRGWWFSDVLWFDVPGHNDPWRGTGKKRRRRPYRIRLPRNTRQHAIATHLIRAIHWSWLQQIGATCLVGPLPEMEEIPPTWFERAGNALVRERRTGTAA